MDEPWKLYVSLSIKNFDVLRYRCSSMTNLLHAECVVVLPHDLSSQLS